MLTSNYETIYSKFLGLIKDYEFLKITDQEAYDNMKEWLEDVYSRPKVRKLFSSIQLDDEVMELSYELRNSIDEAYDKHFVEGLMAHGMVIGWLAPRVNKSTLLDQYFGNSDKKHFSQSSHMGKIKELYEKSESILDKDYTRDHGYASFVIKGEKI